MGILKKSLWLPKPGIEYAKEILAGDWVLRASFSRGPPSTDMATGNLTPPTPTNLLARSEMIISLALFGVLLIFLVPLPTKLLDVLLVLNLGGSMLMLLYTLSVRQPLEFSTFPSLLLLLTLYRLALNVATTRLILLNANAGDVVQGFGQFVVGGNLVVGLVIFLILIVIQFVVITRGATRVSEVAARFTLDAMPGKQMAIDAELNAGMITEDEARRRRRELMRESEFYGTMDGAGKFVRGDAVAGIIITAINLIGGIIIGVTKGQSIGSAIKTYSILTVGDGLITQIPALIVATASGILVTKSTSQTSLGQDISTQFRSSSGPMRLGAFILMGLSIIPGFPAIPFLVLGGMLFLLSRKIEELLLAQPAPATAAGTAAAAGPPGPGAEPGKATDNYLDDFLQSDRISLEIGARLIPLVDTRRGMGLLERIKGLRRDLAQQSGLWVPIVRVRDNINLDPEAYRILISGREVARGAVKTDLLMAIDPGGTRFSIPGEETREPAFGMPARWISETEQDRAKMAGYTVVDAPTVLVTHLGEVVRRHAHELLSREDLKSLIEKVRETSGAVVDELIPNMLTMGTLHRVLTLLLEERVPITNLTRILESLATALPGIKDPADLVERVRVDLGRTICDRFRDPHDGKLRILVIEPRHEFELRRMVQADKTLALDSTRYQLLVERVRTEVRNAHGHGHELMFVCDASLRRPLRQLLARLFPDLSIVAVQEIPADLPFEVTAMISFDDSTGGSSTLNGFSKH